MQLWTCTLRPVYTSWYQCNLYLRRRRRLCFWFGLFVCLSVCPSDYSQTCERILTKFFVGVGHGSRTKSELEEYRYCRHSDSVIDEVRCGNCGCYTGHGVCWSPDCLLNKTGSVSWNRVSLKPNKTPTLRNNSSLRYIRCKL